MMYLQIKPLFFILSVLFLAIVACSGTQQPPTEVAAADPVDPPTTEVNDPLPSPTVENSPTTEPSATPENTATKPPPTAKPTATKRPPTPIPTATQRPPTPIPTATQRPPTATPTSECVVLQQLNFRNGPGTAYYNTIGVVNQDTIVAPTGYYPQGVPGGSWVLVNVNNKMGWIAAGSDYINCNFDLASLPSVEVDPPPPPPFPQSVRISKPDGNFGSELGLPDIVVDELDGGFLRVRLFVDNEEQTGDNGLERISFKVETAPDVQIGSGGEVENPHDDSNAVTVYETVENNAAYCIFGGNDPCNNWPKDGNTFIWEGPDGNIPVSEGWYWVVINPEHVDYGFLEWRAYIYVELP